MNKLTPGTNCRFLELGTNRRLGRIVAFRSYEDEMLQIFSLSTETPSQQKHSETTELRRENGTLIFQHQ